MYRAKNPNTYISGPTGQLYVEETHVDVEERAHIGRSPIMATGISDPGELFRRLQREHGRCTGRVYIDAEDSMTGEARTIPIGWVFRKRKQYSDSPDTYLHETWVTVHCEPPETETRYWLADLDGPVSAE